MATKVGEVTDAKGTWDVFENGSRELRIISAAYQLELDAGGAVFTAKKTLETSNADRIKVLALRAKRYAQDPVVNAADQLNDRLQHELLARLANEIF